MAKKSNDNIFEFDSEAEAIKALTEEGRKLKYIALKLWRKYLSEYKPKRYVRTRDSQNAIKLGKVKKHGEDSFSLELTFDDDLSYHDSVVKGNQPQGHSFMLISEGWKNRKGKNKNIHRFGYFEGINYIERVREAFNDKKHAGIILEIEWNGSKFKKKKWNQKNAQPNVLK
jgi:hypothetical protein